MLRMLFDVNVLVSSMITRGKPRELWLKAREKRFALIFSKEIISEFVRVMDREKFSKYVEEEDMRVFLQALYEAALFEVKSRFKVVKKDPEGEWNLFIVSRFDGKGMDEETKLEEITKRVEALIVARKLAEHAYGIFEGYSQEHLKEFQEFRKALLEKYGSKKEKVKK